MHISAHVESDLVNLSVWRADTCVGTVRLLPAEVADLMAGRSEGLAEIARAHQVTGTHRRTRRLRLSEERLAGLQSRLGPPGRRAVAPLEWVGDRLARRRWS